MKSLATIVIFAALATAGYSQDANPRPEIRGTVLEYGTRFGLSGAQVSLFLEDQKQPVRTTVTDSNGVFRLQPDEFGHYRVQVSLEGYLYVLDGPPGLNLAGMILPGMNLTTAQAAAVITKGYPAEEVHFNFYRPAELSGRVIDEDTGQPVPKASVALVVSSVMNGQRTVSHGQPVLTDNDGRFVFSNLMPGEYAVETMPRVLGGSQIVKQFSEEELKQVDRDVEKAFWPGGGDFNSVALIRVSSGASASVGTIKLRTVPYYRVHVQFPPANCPAGANAKIQFRLASPGPAPDPVNGQVPCGSDFLIRGVQRGSYELVVFAGRAETLALVSVPVNVADQSVDAIVALNRGVDLDGKIVVPDDATAPEFGQMTLMVQMLRPIAGSPPVTPDAQGRFHIVNVPLGAQNVELLRSSGGFYLREIRYNGAVQPGYTFDLTGNSQSQLLELVVDNKPGAIGGVVQESDHQVIRPYVVVAKWPPADMLATSIQRLDGGEDGKFRIGGLAPGEYRVLAVSSTSKEKIGEPGILERLLPSALKVTLDRGVTQNIELKLADPGR